MMPHHIAWLNNHPERDEQWLRERLWDGFQIHHIDGNHNNNAPENLILIEGDDHMRLHEIPVRRKHTQRGKRGPQKRLATRLRAAEELMRTLFGG